MALAIGTKAGAFSFSDQTGKELKFPDDFNGPMAIFFLRHLGCPLCKAKIDELKIMQPRFARKGIRLVVVVQSTPKRAAEVHLKQSLPFMLVPDRERVLYQRFEVPRGGLKEFAAPAALMASIRATFKGHLHGKIEGDELQIPASFLLAADGSILFAHYGKDISDFGDVDELLAYA